MKQGHVLKRVSGCLLKSYQASNNRLKSSAVENFDAIHNEDVSAKPYSEMPGPQPLPLLGNSWRFLPIIGTHLVYSCFKFLSGLTGIVFLSLMWVFKLSVCKLSIEFSRSTFQKLNLEFSNSTWTKGILRYKTTDYRLWGFF